MSLVLLALSLAGDVVEDAQASRRLSLVRRAIVLVVRKLGVVDAGRGKAAHHDRLDPFVAEDVPDFEGRLGNEVLFFAGEAVL